MIRSLSRKGCTAPSVSCEHAPETNRARVGTRTPCIQIVAELGMDALAQATKLPLECALHLKVPDPSCQFYRLRVPSLSAETPLMDHARDTNGLRSQPREESVVQRWADEGALEDGGIVQAGLFVLFVA